jgi:hypothetical protein
MVDGNVVRVVQSTILSYSTKPIKKPTDKETPLEEESLSSAQRSKEGPSSLRLAGHYLAASLGLAYPSKGDMRYGS